MIAHNVKAITTPADNNSLPRHRWYPIKEGFSAKLVSEAIKEGPKAASKIRIIEPFSGSGTAPVESALLGARCSAFEVNPFLAFVGKAKLKQPNVISFEKSGDVVLRGISRPVTTELEQYSTFSEKKGQKRWLFNKDVLRAFAGGWKASHSSGRDERCILRLALIRAAMDNCNAYPDGKCLRYKRLETYEGFNANSFKTRFVEYIAQMKEDLKSSPVRRGLSQVNVMDSRNLHTRDGKIKFDLCVTSPPYLNSFDYSDVYRPELFLGGFVTNNRELMRIRLMTVRSHVQATWRHPVQKSFGEIYTEVMRRIEVKKDALWSQRIPSMIQAYFEDMHNLLKVLKHQANKRATMKIAVSTSAYGGVVIPVDLILSEIAEQVGWLLEEVLVVRRIRSSAQLWKHEDNQEHVPELRESIIILNAPA